MNDPKSPFWRKLLVLPPLIAGIVILLLLTAKKKEPALRANAPTLRVLRVIPVLETSVIPRALGYGTAQPEKVWQAVAEVKGRVIKVHPNLRSGMIVTKDTELLRIDPKEYELAVARLEAEIQKVEAQLADLGGREANIQASLKIEESSYLLAQKLLTRNKKLAKENAISEEQADRLEREVLGQQQSVQNLKNSLSLIPTERKTLEASKSAAQYSLAEAQLNIEKTIMSAPFDCRLSEVKLEPKQFVSVGQVLFEAQGTAVSEVEAHLAPEKVGHVMAKSADKPIRPLTDLKEFQRVFNMEAIVRIRSGKLVAEWKGRLALVRELIDPVTRTVGLVVAVDKPYEKAIPGIRPPLVKGMYCEVEFRGKPIPNKIVLPRSAVQDDAVYVLTAENKLKRRKIEVEFYQGELVCIKKGLQPGESVVVSDPTPAIEGTLVEPREDKELLKRLQDMAKGTDPLR